MKYGKNDQRVTPEPLMRKHKTGSAKNGGIVQIAHQLGYNIFRYFENLKPGGNGGGWVDTGGMRYLDRYAE
ncbi:MAG TPA: hypothetical protein PKM00_10000, partial [Prolixibacteraceae bacterium]|nr:hypothetical protein [Prolixibacteraceae bacterium]